jgi:FtsP/CotA-like multicopper oxidase with cupredoxin domain
MYLKAFVSSVVLSPWWLTPVTAELKEYTWHVHPRRSRTPLSPDCFLDRDMLLINDKNPGEILRASVGDKVRITIVNHSPSEGLTMHYHGISMLDQPYSDGAASRSQCSVGSMQVSHRSDVVCNLRLELASAQCVCCSNPLLFDRRW